MESKIQNKNKSKRFNFLYSRSFVFLVTILMLSVSVLAFYAFTYEKSVTYEIVGSKPDLLVLTDLTNQVFNVSNSSLNLSTTQDLKIVNQNGNANMTYTLNVSTVNLDPGNCTINGDITFEFRKDDDGLIPNNSNFIMDAGLNNFNFTAIAVNNRVCPQNVTPTITLFGV